MEFQHPNVFQLPFPLESRVNQTSSQVIYFLFPSFIKIDLFRVINNSCCVKCSFIRYTGRSKFYIVLYYVGSFED